MTRLIPASAALVATLLATGLAAQNDGPRCPNGESRADAISISVDVDAHPTRVAAVLDSLLERDGYEVRGSPGATGTWSIAPRFTWPDELKNELWVQDPHPGLQMMVGSEKRADSTHVEIAARVVCNPPTGKGADELSPLTLMAAMQLVSGLTTAMDTLKAQGVDLRAPVERSQFSIAIPDSVGPFVFAGRQDYEDPRLGTSVRYAREEDGMYFDVYVYPGPPADERCPQACAEQWVRDEAQQFIDSAPDFIQAGHFRRMDVVRNEAIAVPPGAAYRAGRHVVMEVVRGQGPATPMQSQYILYTYPGYMVKVRATYPPSTKMEGTVRTFVADLLEALVRD
jgi:hypothetical protein